MIKQTWDDKDFFEEKRGETQVWSAPNAVVHLLRGDVRGENRSVRAWDQAKEKKNQHIHSTFFPWQKI